MYTCFDDVLAPDETTFYTYTPEATHARTHACRHTDACTHTHTKRKGEGEAIGENKHFLDRDMHIHARHTHTRHILGTENGKARVCARVGFSSYASRPAVFYVVARCCFFLNFISELKKIKI